MTSYIIMISRVLPFLVNMASLIKWLRFTRKSKREEKVNFLD